MKRSRWFDWASVVVLGALAVMVGVFFSCAGDDDDDDGGGGDSCESVADHLEDCWYDYFGPNGKYDSRFMAWCNGAGYDEVGRLGIYDYDPYCFTGSCAEIYDKGYNDCIQN